MRSTCLYRSPRPPARLAPAFAVFKRGRVGTGLRSGMRGGLPTLPPQGRFRRMTPVANGSQPPPDFSGLRKAVEGMRSKIAASILPIPIGQAGDIVGVMDALRKHLSTATPEHAEAVKHWCAGTLESWVTEKARESQRTLLREYVNSQKDALCRILGKRIHVEKGNPCSCEELFPDIVARVGFEKPDQWTSNRPFDAWVITIARNLQIDCLRRQKTRDRFGSGSPADLSQAPEARSLTPLEQMIAAEEEAERQHKFNAVQECSQKLTPIERLVYEMQYIQQRRKTIPAVAVWTREDTVLNMLHSRRSPGDIATEAHHGLRDFANKRAQQGQPIAEFPNVAGQSLQRLKSRLGVVRITIKKNNKDTEVDYIDEVDRRIRAKVDLISFGMRRKLRECVEQRVKQ